MLSLQKPVAYKNIILLLVMQAHIRDLVSLK